MGNGIEGEKQHIFGMRSPLAPNVQMLLSSVGSISCMARQVTFTDLFYVLLGAIV